MPDIAEQAGMNEERLIINDSFLVILSKLLVERPQMTATEVAARYSEKE